MKGHPGSEGLDIVAPDSTASKQLSHDGTFYLSSAYATERIPPPPATENETPAQKRMRTHFLSSFMKLKQPAMPGIWGSWDPVEGQPKEVISDWPQYDPSQLKTDIPSQTQQHLSATGNTSIPDGTISLSPAQSAAEHPQAKQPSITASPNSNQEATPVNPITGNLDARPRQSQDLACLPGMLPQERDSDYTPPSPHQPPSRPQPQVRPRPSQPSISLAQITAELGLPRIPSPPTHLFTAASEPTGTTTAAPAQPLSQPRYKSPPTLAKLFNATTDLEKDAQAKRVVADAQRDYDNGPMWGVATKPPITFDGDEDYGDVLGGDPGRRMRFEQAVRNQARSKDATVGPDGETQAMEKDVAGSADLEDDEGQKEGIGTRGQKEKEKEKGQEKPGSWFGQGSIWNV